MRTLIAVAMFALPGAVQAGIVDSQTVRDGVDIDHIMPYNGLGSSPLYPAGVGEIFSYIDFEEWPPTTASGFEFNSGSGLTEIRPPGPTTDSVDPNGHSFSPVMSDWISLTFEVGPGANPDYPFSFGYAHTDGLMYTTQFSVYDRDGVLLDSVIYAMLGAEYDDPTDTQFWWATYPGGIGSIRIEQIGAPEHRFEIDHVQWLTVPEPATLGLLACGALVLLRRKP